MAEPVGAGAPPHGPWQRLRALPDESPLKVFVVTLAVCLVCSTLVATSVVVLRPYQIAHRERERDARFLALASEIPGLEGLVSGVGETQIAAHVVDLSTGRIAEGLDPDSFDPEAAVRSPESGRALGAGEDEAGIGRRPEHGVVYLVREGDALRLIVLPVYGAGYQSTLRGFLALDEDGNTIRGLSFYEQAETPGIGDQVQEADWLAQWPGKQLRDETGTLRIRVTQGRVAPSEPAATYAVEGISGATRTSNAVERIVRFWTGPLGFGPFLDRARQGELALPEESS